MTWAIAWQVLPREGELACGDAVQIAEHAGVRRIAVVDALGHGPAAAEVAHLAVRHLEAAPLDLAVEEVVRGLHDALRGTRGAAATICRIEGARIEGCGVGNVEVRSVGSPVPIVLTGGIVGVRLPRPRIFGATLAQKTRLVLFSDGISSRVPISSLSSLDPDAACRAILGEWRKAHDDASVVVADVEVRSDATNE